MPVHRTSEYLLAISEPNILEGEPIGETLHQMIDLVDRLIPVFKPLL